MIFYLGDSGNPLFNYVNIKGRIRAVQFGMVAGKLTPIETDMIDVCSPLVAYLFNIRLFIVLNFAIKAGHSQCGKAQASGFPGIYTDINYYLNWILDNLEESER